MWVHCFLRTVTAQRKQVFGALNAWQVFPFVLISFIVAYDLVDMLNKLIHHVVSLLHVVNEVVEACNKSLYCISSRIINFLALLIISCDGAEPIIAVVLEAVAVTSRWSPCSFVCVALSTTTALVCNVDDLWLHSGFHRGL